MITLPNIHIEGLVFGSPFVELNDSTYITSSSGFTAKIDYTGKGWLSGKKNSFTATLYPTGRKKDILYNLGGQWTKTWEVREGASKTGPLLDTYDADAEPVTPLQVASLEEQGPLESRRAWSRVAQGIADGDMDLVGVEKTKIEVAQRDLRVRERDEGRSWQRRYFTKVESCPLLHRLAHHICLNAEPDKTGGIWRFAADGKASRKDGEL